MTGLESESNLWKIIRKNFRGSKKNRKAIEANQLLKKANPRTQRQNGEGKADMGK